MFDVFRKISCFNKSQQKQRESLTNSVVYPTGWPSVVFLSLTGAIIRRPLLFLKWNRMRENVDCGKRDAGYMKKVSM